MDNTDEMIMAAEPDALARYGVAFVRRLGQLGRDGADQLQEALSGVAGEPEVQEGMAQLDAVLGN